MQLLQVVRGNLVQPHILQDLQECGVLLAVHLLKFYCHQPYTSDNVGFVEEEIIRLVQIAQHLLFWAVGHHWGQLEHVAHKHHLFASEGHVVAKHSAQGVIYRIHYVAPNHRHLVDNNRVGMQDGQYPIFVQLATRGRRTNLQRQAEETVYCLSSRQNGGDTRGRQHHKTFVHQFLHSVQKSGLARAGPSCQEETAVGVGYQLVGKYLLCIGGVNLYVVHNYLFFLVFHRLFFMLIDLWRAIS